MICLPRVWIGRTWVGKRTWKKPGVPSVHLRWSLKSSSPSSGEVIVTFPGFWCEHNVERRRTIAGGRVS